MLNLSFSHLDSHTVIFNGFIDKNKIFYEPKDISLFYPGIGISDIENIGRKKLRELVNNGLTGSKPDAFYIDFDGKL